jgi:hypothetical protein
MEEFSLLRYVGNFEVKYVSESDRMSNDNVFWWLVTSIFLETHRTNSHRNENFIPYICRRFRSIEESNDLIENRTRDLQACSLVPQPNTLPRAPL